MAPWSKGVVGVLLYERSAPSWRRHSRLVVGIGIVEELGKQRHYQSSDSSKRDHPIWQRDIAHSIRPGGSSGFLVPFHDYLATTGDPTEDERRQSLAARLAVVPDRDRLVEFSYRTEHVSPDSTIGILTQGHQSCAIPEGRWDRGGGLGSC